MKRPVFSQLDRLADYGGDEGRAWKDTRRRRTTTRRELDELIREDGRVVNEGNTDADA